MNYCPALVHSPQPSSAKGNAALGIDMLHGPHHDLSDPIVVRAILGWLSSGQVSAVWIAAPCNSWSTARHGPPDSAWCKLRTSEHIPGLCNLHNNAQQIVALGNRFAHIAAKIAHVCLRAAVPCHIENPRNSFCGGPPLQNLIGKPECGENFHDACQYGERWRKQTRVIHLLDKTHDSVQKRCTGKGGMCSRTRQPHIVLTGRCRDNQQVWTKITEPYLTKLCAAYTILIINQIIRKRISEMMSVCY